MRLPYFAALLTLLLAACGVQKQPLDMADYQMWLAKDHNEKAAKQLQAYLDHQSVGRVFPTYQLLRSDTRWKKCGAEPFAVPPRKLWPAIVPALRIVRDHVVPKVGQVEALSVFRSPQINSCIRGASKSFHLQFRAIDMKPVKAIKREILIGLLCRLHRERGFANAIGLGVYKSSRFHVDGAGYRTWGHDYRAGSSPCRARR